jgi:hypothetical protein
MRIGPHLIMDVTMTAVIQPKRRDWGTAQPKFEDLDMVFSR